MCWKRMCTNAGYFTVLPLLETHIAFAQVGKKHMLLASPFGKRLINGSREFAGQHDLQITIVKS